MGLNRTARLHIYKTFFTVLLFLAVFCSCKRTRPQLPSNKSVGGEAAVIDMARINKELIRKEDSLLLQYVEKKDKAYQKADIGFWYKINRSTDGGRLSTDHIYTINYEVYLLDGSLAERVNGLKITLGKKEVIPGLDAALQLMKVGESASFLFPWNLAYGLKGQGQVPPYTSVIFHIEVVE